MGTRAGDRKNAAVRRLSQLAAALRETGLSAEIEPDRQPFPGLAVTAPAASAVILAGAAHYWRQKANGDLEWIGPLDEPATTARTVYNRLTGRKTQR